MRKPMPPPIDRDKLRARLRLIGDEYVFYMLDEAIDLLPPAALAKLVARYIDLKQLRPDADAGGGKRSLLEDMKAFDAASRAGKYYVSFNVNSKNYMEKSTGTRAFIADSTRLVDRCVAQGMKGNVAETRAAFDMIVALLRYIDEAHDDIIFFADEGGAYEVGVDWRVVLPAWFGCLAKTAEPEEFARVVVEAIDEFADFAPAPQLATARKLGNAAQRKALDARVAATPARRR